MIINSDKTKDFKLLILTYKKRLFILKKKNIYNLKVISKNLLLNKNKKI